MQPIHAASITTTVQANALKLREEARRFITALTDRLGELENIAHLACKYNVFSVDEYAEFKQLFLKFRDLCEEFQVLSRMTEDSLANIDQRDSKGYADAVELDSLFRALQLPMLRAMIRTNLRLLKVWNGRLMTGEGMPYGSRELFRETVRIIDTARNELLRPRYLDQLEEEAIQEADEADHLLKTLIQKSPSLFDFVGNDAIDHELMNLIKGLPPQL